MRSWLAYQLMRIAVRVHTDTAVRLALAMAIEHGRQELEEGVAKAANIMLHHFVREEDEDGNVTLTPINRDPTVH